MRTIDLTRDERAVRQTSGPVLGMVLFVASEAMFFATFFGAYFTIYSVNPVWPPAGFPHLEPGLATVLTAVLVTSSLHPAARRPRDPPRPAPRPARLARADHPARGRLPRPAALRLLAARLQHARRHLRSLFYVMTGLHMAHVFGGVVFLVLVLVQGIGGQLSDASHDSLEAGAIYWHFVDVVWICLFTTFYLAGLADMRLAHPDPVRPQRFPGRRPPPSTG